MALPNTPSERDFTYYSHVHMSYSSIDLFLVDKFLLQSITNSEIHDHASVSIVVVGGHIVTRANRWRNYVLLMSNLDNLEVIAKSIREYFKLNVDSVDSSSLPTISPEDLQNINQPFSLTEITKVIKQLLHNKSPGPDGFSSEYYQIFSDIVSPHLVPLYGAAMSSTSFPP